MKYFLIALIVFTGVQCTPRLAPDSGWGRGRWVVVEMKGVPVQQSGGRRDASINFEVDQKKFRGSGGCNQINGAYTIDRKNIKFTDVVSTKMSCADISFENTFLSLLNDVNRYELSGEELRLKKRKETVLVLRAR
jgi:heat shock protein HslJ